MSILLVGLPPEVVRGVVDELVAQGDEVRVIEQDARRAAEWKARGAHPARGAASDPDLIERAAQGVRTLAVGAADGAAGRAVVEAAVSASRRAAARNQGLRLVLVGADPGRDTVEAVRTSGMDHVVLRTGTSSRRRPRRARVPAETIVAALDAADDLAGNPRLELDLREPEAWRALGLER